MTSYFNGPPHHDHQFIAKKYHSARRYLPTLPKTAMGGNQYPDGRAAAPEAVSGREEATHQTPPSIQVRNLNYAFPDGTSGLEDVRLSFPAGSRTLLIGANGAGKTTMLRLLSGKRLAPAGSITINGLDPFKENLTGITYLGLEWVLNPIVRSDISVPTLLASVGGDAYPARRDELVRILDVDLRWHLHAVSDGERRRVQLVMGLLRPWDILLLDEVTVDLDLLSRRRFLEWLKTETETEAESDTGTVMRRGSSSNGEQAPRRRKPTVVYASHIMDGLSEWPTHLVHMALGRVKQWGTTSTWTEAGALNTQLPANSITNSSSTRANDPSSSVSLANDRTVEENKEQKHQHQHQHQIPNDAVAVPAPTHPSHPPTGKLDLGDLVMHWLTEDLRERGPRNQPSQGKTYGSTHGIGGYGSETKTRKMGGAS